MKISLYNISQNTKLIRNLPQTVEIGVKLITFPVCNYTTKFILHVSYDKAMIIR